MPGPPKTRTDEEIRRQKAAQARRRRAESVRVGPAIDHWNVIRDLNGYKTDEQVAELLLTCYYESDQARELKKSGLSNFGGTGSMDEYKPDAAALDDDQNDSMCPSPEHRELKEEPGKDQSLLRECIGEHVSRWNQVKESENLETDMEVADLLLNLFIVIQDLVINKSSTQNGLTKLQIPGLSGISGAEKANTCSGNVNVDVLEESVLEGIAKADKQAIDKDSNVQEQQTEDTTADQESGRRRKITPVRYRDYDYSDVISDGEASTIDAFDNDHPVTLPGDTMSSFINRHMKRLTNTIVNDYARRLSRIKAEPDFNPNTHDGLEDETCTVVKIEPVSSDDETRDIPSKKSQRKQRQESDEDYEPSSDTGSEYEYKRDKEKQESDNVYEPTSDTDTEYQYKKFKCEYCEMAFTSRPVRRKHILADHPEEKAYKCSQCKEGFLLRKELDNHKLMKLCKKNFQCEVCLKRFTNIHSLKTHMDLHAEVPKYSCNKCDTQCRTKSALRSHNLRYHFTGPGFLCQHCGKSFKEKSKLRWHTLSCLNIKDFKCKVCSKGFATKPLLASHEKIHESMHANLMNICEICGKNFRHRSQMKGHLQTHSTERPFSCTVCSKAFAVKQCLKKHMKVHTQERNHQCSYCQKRFNRPEALRTHILQHTGETPFKCDRCGQGFKQRVLLKRHMVQQHKHELSSEEIAKYKSSTTVQLGIEELVNKP